MRPRLLPILLWIGSLSVTVAFTGVSAWGLRAPARNEAEALVLDRANRMNQGQPVTADPEEDPARTIMPGAPAAVSFLAGTFGPGTWQPRILALLATLATALVITLAVRAETTSDTIGVAAGGVFLAARLLVPDPGAAVVEACALFLLTAGFATLRFARGMIGTLVAAVWLSAAWFTHPLASWFLVAALAHALAEQPRRALVLAFYLAAFLGAGHVLLSRAFGPSFNAEVWRGVEASLQFHPERALDLVGSQLLGRLGVLTLVTVLTFALPVRPWRGAGGAWTWMALAGLGASLSLSQSTSWTQALLPSLAALAVVGPVSLQRVTRHLSAWPGADRLGGQGVVLAGLALQLVALLAAAPTLLQAG